MRSVLLSRGVRFAAIVTLSQLAVTALAQSEIQTRFEVMGGWATTAPPARPQPATITMEDTATLKSKDYFLIGISEAHRPDTEGEQALDELRAALLRKAGDSGGDLVSWLPSSLHGSVDVPTGKTRNVCVSWHQLSVGVVDNIQQFADICDKSHDEPVMRKQKILSVQAMVYRYDPEHELAKAGQERAKAMPSTWNTTHVQDLKEGVQDKAKLSEWFGKPTFVTPGRVERGDFPAKEGCVERWFWSSVRVSTDGAAVFGDFLSVDLDVNGKVCGVHYTHK